MLRIFSLPLFLLMSSLCGASSLSELPSTPPLPCASGCNQKMLNVDQGFQNHPFAPRLEPGVYTGNCYFKSSDDNPEIAQRSVILLDKHPLEDRFYFSTRFSFFGDPSRYADWDLEKARKEMNGSWKYYEPIEIKDHTARVIVMADEDPAWIYYLRQDPATRTIYYISYWGSWDKISFCEMTPHAN